MPKGTPNITNRGGSGNYGGGRLSANTRVQQYEASKGKPKAKTSTVQKNAIGGGKGLGRASGGSIRGDQSKLAKWEKDLLLQARRVAKSKKETNQYVKEMKKQGKPVGPYGPVSSRKPSVPVKKKK